MPDLMDCQRDLAGALNDKRESARAMRWLAGDASLTERRLAIYRANVEAAANKALSAAYPVIRQVVGGARFDDLARAYQRHAPSRSGDLNGLGSMFADFIADDDGARLLPYLPDLARLEWAAHRAYGAADAEALDADALAQLPVHRQSMIRFSWAAGTALIAREGLRVAVHAVSAGAAAFVAASLGGASFGAAAEQALADEPGLDLASLLRLLMARQVICGFNDDKDE